MKRNLILIALVLPLAIALGGPEKLAPDLRLLLQHDLSSPLAQGLGLQAEDGLRVLIWTREAGAAWELPGFTPSGVWGTLATGWVDPAALSRLAEVPELLYIEPARRLRPSLDVSVPEVGAPVLWAGPPGTRGGGTLVAIVDSGIDPLHPDFRVDRDGDGWEEGSRILFSWDQTLSPGGSTAPWGLSYGRVFTQGELEAQIASGYSESSDTLGHGTHVAGIAAGDGSSSTAGYVGVAPEANLIVVKTTFYEDAVLDAVSFAFDRAEELGLPCVVNLSLGGHSGPHDGTSLFERAVDAFLDRPGRAIVVAAGNEAQEGIHVGAEVHSPTTWHLVPEASSVTARFWHPFQLGFTVEVAAPGGERTSVLPVGQGYLATPAGQAWIDNSGYPDPRNGDRQIFLQLTGVSSGASWAITSALSAAASEPDWLRLPDGRHFMLLGTSMSAPTWPECVPCSCLWNRTCLGMSCWTR